MKRQHRLALTGLSAVLLSACAIEEPMPESREPIAAVSEGIAITRVIPIRFIHTSNCDQGPTCFGAEPFAQLQAVVDRLNVVFGDAGVKFWIKSNEIYNVPTFRPHDNTTTATFSAVKDELRVMFPNMPSNAYSASDSKTLAQWLLAAATYYGDDDVVHVYLHASGPESFASFPERGRSVHLIAPSMYSEANDAASTLIAHEMGHFFGVRHTFAGLTGINPETEQEWTQADRWDLLYCDADPPRFWSSKAAFLADSCANLSLIDRDADCVADPAPYGPLKCTITTSSNTQYTYSAGSPALAGLASSNPNVVHNPPSTFKYGANVMGYRNYWGMDVRPPTFFSGSQLAMMDKYLDFDIDYYAESQDDRARSDGTDPLGSIGSDGRNSLRTRLGTAEEDFVYWANGPHANAVFSFHAVDHPVSGTGYEPVSGDFDGDGRDDVFWYYGGSLTGSFWWGASDREFDTDDRADFSPGLGYQVFAGDFNGDGKDDIFFYKPGSGTDHIYFGSASRSFTTLVQTVGSTYTPIVGNFDGADGDDIFWYSESGEVVHRWYSTGGTTFDVHDNYAVDAGGPFVPIVGNFDGTAGDDIFWYKAGSGTDRLWYSLGGGSLSFDKVNAIPVAGTYLPVAGDFDGDTRTDIFWDAMDHATDFIWAGVASHTTQFDTSRAATVYGAFNPVSGDFDQDGRTDIFWYRD